MNWLFSQVFKLSEWSNGSTQAEPLSHPRDSVRPLLLQGLETGLYTRLRAEAAWLPELPVSSGLHHHPRRATRPLPFHQQTLRIAPAGRAGPSTCALRPLHGSFLLPWAHKLPFLDSLFPAIKTWGFGEQPIVHSLTTPTQTHVYSREQLCQLCAPRLPGQLWVLKTAPHPPFALKGWAAGLALLTPFSSRPGCSCKQFVCAVASLKIVVFVVTEVFRSFFFLFFFPHPSSALIWLTDGSASYFGSGLFLFLM